MNGSSDDVMIVEFWLSRCPPPPLLPPLPLPLPPPPPPPPPAASVSLSNVAPLPRERRKLFTKAGRNEDDSYEETGRGSGLGFSLGAGLLGCFPWPNSMHSFLWWLKAMS